jgi:hypothetical protein
MKFVFLAGGFAGLLLTGSVRRTIAPGTSSSQSPVSEGPVERKSGSRDSSKR